MHEGAVCREVMDIVTQATRANDLTKIWEITVTVGPCSCVNEGQLNFYFDVAKPGTCMEDAVIRMERDETLTGVSQMYVKSIRGD